MSTTDDHNGEMNVHGLLDDATAAAILAGRSVRDPALRPVAGLVAEMRSLAQEAAPAPSAQLAAILAGGPVAAAREDSSAATAARPVSDVRGRRARLGRPGPSALSRLARNVAAAGLAARIALGAGVAAAGMTGAAAAGVLPGPVQDAVAGAMETVTPFEFPRHADDRPEPSPGVIPGDSNLAPGTVPDEPSDGLPGSADPQVPSAPGMSPAGSAPSSPAPTAGTVPTTVPATTPTTGAPRSETDMTPGTTPVRQPDPAAGTVEPAPATPDPAPSKPEAGSTGAGATTGTAPDRAAPGIDDGGAPAPVSPGSGRP